MKTYIDKNVLESAKERISFIFDRFEHINISVSAGKDSEVLYQLSLTEAIKRNRKIQVFFLDQEIEYNASIVRMKELMNHSNVIPLWYQVPLYMTNATSYEQYFVYAWGKGEQWIREKEDIAIKEINQKYPERFYKFFDWFEKQQPESTAFLVGLRADESLDRFRTMIKNPGYQNILWSTKIQKSSNCKFYPIYDWTIYDIWKYIWDNKINYNKIYDLMFWKTGINHQTMRVSNLIHEKSFNCLTDLQELEPETYEKVLKRIKGSHIAALYAKESMIFNAQELPASFNSWLDYRNHLIQTSPIKLDTNFINRLNSQDLTDSSVCRQQCKQLMINDWENNVPVIKSDKKKKEDWKSKWMAIL
jgi:predicted phosphoadenosine phosphosulfate sulfurtransferase